MLKTYKKQIIATLVVVILFIVAFLIGPKLFKNSKPLAPSSGLVDCKNNSSDKAVTCAENFIYSSVQKNPDSAGKLLNELWSGELNIDLRSFSPVAHDVGMLLIDQNIKLTSAMNFCGPSFKGACIHGAVMEYVDNEYPSNVPAKTFINLCASLGLQITDKRYEDCAHAIGHELRAKLKGTNEYVVSECDYFSVKYRNACASGVLMEASKGNQGIGYHIDSPVGKIQFDCSKMPQEYKLTCYSSLGSYMQYEADSPPFENTFKLCSSFSTTESAYCFSGADERLLMAKNGNMDLAVKFCQGLPIKEMNGCLMAKDMSLDSLE